MFVNAARRFYAMAEPDRARLTGLFEAWCAAGHPEVTGIGIDDRELLYWMLSSRPKKTT